MSSLRSQIGPLSALFAFEAAGRLGSFTLAAAELGVTQGAVSKQISLLEERLGMALFIRLPRRVDLSFEGQELFNTVTASLSSIAQRMHDFESGQSRPVTVALSIAMSQFWLMPKLAAFAEQNPSIPLRILSQDDLANVVGADVVIRFQDGGRPGQRWLCAAEVRAMASRRFLHNHPVKTAAEVLAAPLVHYDTPDHTWIRWQDWAAAAAVPFSRAPSFSVSRYQDAIVAALRDQGIVLVWTINGDSLVSGGELLPVAGPVLRPAGGFYFEVLTPKRHGVGRFVDWLTAIG